MSKKVLSLAFALIFPLVGFAQKKDSIHEYHFTDIKTLPITSIKNQASSGTCWSFSGVSFLESELLRKGKGEYDLSEMFIVRHNWREKAKNFIRLHGTSTFAGGGSFADVFETIDEAGLVPQSAYSGLVDGETRHNHKEMDTALHGFITPIAESKGVISNKWKKGIDALLDVYLGKAPEKFTYKGKEYTPKSFAKELGLKKSDYISITSYTHHPYYSSYPILVSDNWRRAESLNIPLDELIQIIDNAIMNGYTVVWGSDVSEIGFSRNGVAVIPDIEQSSATGSDQARWIGLSPSEKRKDIFLRIQNGQEVKELKITPEMRQKAYDNYETTDDHGMHIFGIAKDQYGKKYYKIKNSWGPVGKYKGIWYISEPFIRYKTMNIVVNKNAIPANILKKINK